MDNRKENKNETIKPKKMKRKTKQQQHLEASRKPVSNLSYENISWKIEKKRTKKLFFR